MQDSERGTFRNVQRAREGVCALPAGRGLVPPLSLALVVQGAGHREELPGSLFLGLWGAGGGISGARSLTRCCVPFARSRAKRRALGRSVSASGPSLTPAARVCSARGRGGGEGGEGVT